ncbi:MAG: DUF348 domain-containing protein [Chloroflexi bacterium]|nr:DUF348 domain-containing protein [Chloroflexota bacterium]MBU1749845.1 DUF348 domain-containing protein [Chloroflexota bacterium]
MARAALARGRDTLAALVRPGVWWGWALALLAGALLAGGYVATQKVVTLDIDGQSTTIYTHQTTVRDVLSEAQVALAVDDQLIPPLDAPIDTGSTIAIQHPFTVTISADGDTTTWRTHQTTVGALLTQAQVSLGDHDVITVNGLESDPLMVLGATADRRTAMAGGSVPHIPQRPVRSVDIAVRRAVALTISDEGVPLSIYTVQDTVGDALRTAGVLVYLADKVSPGLGTVVAPGLRVNIQRSIPYVITADGLVFASRTRKPTLGQAIEEEGLRLVGKDRMEPAGPNPVQVGSHVRVVRVREVYLTDDDPIAYKTVWWGDSDLELDNQRLDVSGIEGVFRRITQIVYEDGQEIKRDIWREWVAQEPITKVVAYGKKIVVREATAEDGTTIQYWRKIRVLATSYHEGECGKDPDHPEYGITYLGWRVRPGIVAVDPRVVNLRGELYVPGYGYSVAGDTGSLIKGMRIDVYFPMQEYVSWNHWVTIYLLAPVPPRDQVRWILPSYPVERQRWLR